MARSNNTVEAHFTLTAYTLLAGVTGEAVNPQQADANASDADGTKTADAGKKAPKKPANKGGKNAEQNAAQN